MCSIKIFFSSFEFNETWWSFSTQQFHQVSLNKNEKKSILKTHLTDGPYVEGRWIWPKSKVELNKKIYLTIESNCKLLSSGCKSWYPNGGFFGSLRTQW